MHIVAFLCSSYSSVNCIVCIPIVSYFMSYFISLHQMTPLHVAVERALTEIVKFLVDRGADITIKDYNGVNIYVCMYGENVFISYFADCRSFRYCLPG